MKKIDYRKYFLPILLVFIIVNSFCLLFKNFLLAKGIDSTVLLGANILLFLLSVITLVMHITAVKNKNPNVFVRSVMAASFIKLMVIAIVAVVYLSVAKENRNIYGVIASLGLYVIYTIIEIRNASLINKENGKN
ncbi:MAG: hypothetical protein ABI653_07500 [Bacteroidota bacterium]